jgi:hypothetical protein
MLTLPAEGVQAINKIHQTNPWVWCWEIEADVSLTARSVFRLVSYPAEIVLPAFDSLLAASRETEGQEERIDPRFAGGKATFSPFPMAQSEIEQNADGDLPSLALTIDNQSRALTPWFHTGDGFVNNRALGVLANLGNLQQTLPFTFRITMATVTAEQATLHMEMPNFMQRSIPEDRHDPRRCRFLFGGHRCGYPVNELGAFFDCDKSIGACILRGDDEVSRNLPRKHPQRYGAFPGLPQA